MSKLFPVAEAYHGKSKTMIECEAILDKACAKIRSTEAPLHQSLNPVFIKVGDMIAKDLGMRKLNLVLVGGGGAHTMPASFPILSRADIDNPKRLDASVVFGTVTMSDSFIRKSGLNGEECLAIILHEVGHLFQRSIDLFLSRLVVLKGYDMENPIWKHIGNIVLTNSAARFILDAVARPLSQFMARINKLPFVKDLLEFINYIDSTIPPLGDNMVFINATRNPASIPIEMLSNMFVGRAEAYADSFATSYGYGPALSSALNKMELWANSRSAKKAMAGDPVAAFCYDYLHFSSLYMNWLLNFDGHPIAIVRILQTKEKLVRELGKQDLDPRTKKAILEDLRFVEAQIKKMSDSPEDRFNKTFQARYTINKAIVAGTHGKKSLLQFYKLEDVQD